MFLINQYEWKRVNIRERYQMEVKEICRILLIRVRYLNFTLSVGEISGAF